MSEQQLNLNCPIKTCPSAPADLTVYNLQDALYFNGVPLSVVAECPPGYLCPPGLLPPVFIYPPGTFPIYIPPGGGGGGGGGFPIVLNIVGCESNLNTILPAGSTQAQVKAAADILIAEAAAQQARCDAISLLPPGSKIPSAITLTDIEQYACVDVLFNAAIFASATPSGAPYTLAVSPQPAWMVTAQNATTLFLSGTPTAIGAVNFTVIATGNNASGSKAYTLNIVGISTASPLTAGTVGSPYSETLDASSIPGVLTWIVTAGALPDGISLNTTTGELSGTPTVEASFNFTISASNGTLGCSKAFTLAIAAGSDCTVFNGIVWGPPDILSSDGGSSSGSFLGANFSGDADAPNSPSSGLVNCIGTFSYTGPAMVCCVDVNFVGNDSGGSASSSWTITVFQDASLIGIFNSLSVAPFQINFLDSPVPSTITITVGWSASVDGGFPGSTSSCTISGAFGVC